MSDNQVNKEHLSAITQVRGTVLQSCIEIEMLMDFYIASHFCKGSEKIYELATIVLAPRVAWREKLAIFGVLIEKYNIPFKTENPNFNKDLTEIIEQRNVFAHLPADTSNDGLKQYKDGVLSFLRFKNFKVEKTKVIEYLKPLNYSKQELQDLTLLLTKYVIAIKKILVPLNLNDN